MIRPILTQFTGVEFERVYHAFQDTHEKVRRTLDRIDHGRTLVLHALVDPDAKRLVRTACVRRRIPHHDLTVRLVQFIADNVGQLPADEVARLHRVDAAYLHRIEAMEFTSEHDDGAGLGTIDQADIVIVGISRVSKTPTSTYLASFGYKVANVSITPETGFPAELREVKKRVVAFTLQPKALREIRAERISHVKDIAYHDMRSVIREVADAEAEYRKRGYPVIDITGKTIEQIAATILQKIKVKKKVEF